MEGNISITDEVYESPEEAYNSGVEHINKAGEANHVKAFECFSYAAEKGYIDAMDYLAWC